MNQAPSNTADFLLGLVPARAGSKRVPDKNIRSFGGPSLLSLAIRGAMDAECIDEVALSTDSPEYVALAAAAGHHEPYRRPAAAARSDGGRGGAGGVARGSAARGM